MLKFRIADAETQRQSVLKNYQTGALIFILRRGLLGWALPMFVFFTLYDYFIIGSHYAVSKPGLQNTAIICLVAGLIVGSLLWLGVARRVRQTRRGE